MDYEIEHVCGLALIPPSFHVGRRTEAKVSHSAQWSCSFGAVNRSYGTPSTRRPFYLRSDFKILNGTQTEGEAGIMAVLPVSSQSIWQSGGTGNGLVRRFKHAACKHEFTTNSPSPLRMPRSVPNYFNTPLHPFLQ